MTTGSPCAGSVSTEPSRWRRVSRRGGRPRHRGRGRRLENLLRTHPRLSALAHRGGRADPALSQTTSQRAERVRTVLLPIARDHRVGQVRPAPRARGDVLAYRSATLVALQCTHPFQICSEWPTGCLGRRDTGQPFCDATRAGDALRRPGNPISMAPGPAFVGRTQARSSDHGHGKAARCGPRSQVA